ncbi:MAG: coenzyme F420-0:L-glutamate ligase [Chloroflexota bacterium]|nr:coenzyme F420-0:L-glutamate ligase [Chloroflexota bacterium]
MQISVIGINSIPEVNAGDDLTSLILSGCETSGVSLQEGDVLVITQKVVSKAEARMLDLHTIEPSPFAIEFATRWGKDPRHTEVVLRESARIVRMDKGIIISETRHGFVCANAGVDASNVPGEHIVCLLPEDPDASAERIRNDIRERTSLDIPVIISDSFGRPWRFGIVNIAIGVSGLMPLIDYRGLRDANGYVLNVTVIAVADELASAAELVMGKLDNCPAAIVRGYPFTMSEGKAREIIMDPTRDMFR